MTAARSEDLPLHPAADPGPDTAATVLEAVSDAARELLRSLPERPERLKVRAAGVSVELDWRPAAASLVLPVPAPATGIGAGAGSGVEAPAPRAGLVPVPDLVAAEPVRQYVCAPSVGAFYRSPEPGAAPFVAEGTEVRAGQQVGIVEVMKLMLPVEADRAGTVAEFLVADGQTVEFGERLVALAPTGARSGV